MLQDRSVVLVTSGRLGSVQAGLAVGVLACRDGGLPSSRGHAAGFVAALCWMVCTALWLLLSVCGLGRSLTDRYRVIVDDLRQLVIHFLGP